LDRPRRKSLFPVLIVTAVVIILVVAAASYYLNTQGQLNTQTPTSACATILSTGSNFVEKGFATACGIDQASDGRLKITVHSYHFAQASDIQFRFAANQQPVLPDEVFILVNVTVENIGGGNTTVGAGWEATVLNGASYVDGVTNFIVNASFPSTYPNQTIPDYERGGGIYLPPGSRADFWIFFYVPFSRVVSSNIAEATSFRLQLVTYKEFSYGGTYIENGGFNCQKVACQDTNTEFVIQP